MKIPQELRLEEEKWKLSKANRRNKKSKLKKTVN